MNAKKLKQLRRELRKNGFDWKQSLYTVGTDQTPTYVNPAAIKVPCTIRLALGSGRHAYKAAKRNLLLA